MNRAFKLDQMLMSGGSQMTWRSENDSQQLNAVVAAPIDSINGDNAKVTKALSFVFFRLSVIRLEYNF